ncbi:MAG TPA: flagellar biosynthesis protein FlhA [Methylomirabilota bacterium]|nr:flagellar biosynthesis protein FlhA [Methylomirabilota bacterium]
MATAATGLGAPGPALRWLSETLRQRDLLFAIFIILVIGVLVIPMPSFLLDVGLAISITLSTLILLVAIMTRRALDFSSFPTVLLVATMIRLTLNLSSTRLILTHGHTGSHAAGHIIEAFGKLLMGGNFVIGIIVFVILSIVSLVVVNKGSGRIAEVAARFSLDAMPGKQMAIDADLSAGLIDENEARRRRKDLEDESAFYGAMDGASKFVKGDAIAGLLIVVINIVGGLITGVIQHGLSFADAAHSYTILTVGDGLVAAVPSILVSVGAGMLVSKAGVGTSAGDALSAQLSQSPKALATAAALLVGLGVTPGMPLLPFFGLAGILGVLAWRLPKMRAAQEARSREDSERQEREKAGSATLQIATDLRFDPVRVELGIAVSSVVMAGADSLGQRVMELRRQLARRYGFVLPTVEIRPNPTLPPNVYVLHLRNVEVARGDLMPARFLVMNPTGAPLDIPGEDTREPAFGLPARWIDATQREAAEIRGYAVVDVATVITVHLTEVIKENMAELLDYAATQKLLHEIGSEHQKLVSDLVPNLLSTSVVQRVLQSLLAEQVSIRDLPVILDALAETAAFSRDPLALSARVRVRLARQICQSLAADDGYLDIVTLSTQWQRVLTDSIVVEGDNRQLAMAPGEIQRFIGAIRTTLQNLAQSGRSPAILVGAEVRPLVRAIVARFSAKTPIISHDEIHPKARIRTLAEISYDLSHA